jgi:hypothetical protein
MDIIEVESIDSFVSEGILYASDELGKKIDFEFRNSCKDNSNFRDILLQYIVSGEPIAYLILITRDSLAEGMSRNRVVQYAFQRRPSINVVSLVENIKAEINYQEARKKIFPLMRETADFLLISMSVNQLFLSKLRERYTFEYLEDKASRYYGQAAVDFKKLGAEDGFVHVLKELSQHFDDYISLMRFFSAEFLNQKVLLSNDFQRLSPERRKEIFDKYIDVYLDKFSDYKTLHSQPLRDDNMISLFVQELNNLGAKLQALNPEFKYKPLEYNEIS